MNVALGNYYVSLVKNGQYKIEEVDEKYRDYVKRKLAEESAEK